MKPVIDLLPIDDLERAGWLKWGLGNCAEWLHYRCDCRSGPWPRPLLEL